MCQVARLCVRGAARACVRYSAQAQLRLGRPPAKGAARALSVGPRVIVADEPVSALDVSMQAQVINLLADLRAKFGVGLVLVAHDLAVAWHVADEIAVMHRGKVVEEGPTEQVLRAPQHEYSRSLIASIPGQGATGARSSTNPRSSNTGSTPSPNAYASSRWG